ncbi:MAG: hypothetical protein ABWW69_02465 [Pyrodictiaceae archaeon]
MAKEPGVEEPGRGASLADLIVGATIAIASIAVLVVYIYLTVSSGNSLGSTGLLLKALGVALVAALYASIAVAAYKILIKPYRRRPRSIEVSGTGET